ncbi:MAG TPA: GNAT family N-acetyltransferase [Spirochaetota bacterium]|nr:GNAT family N-acetyltransferase [Spirochaetota bacterium]HPI90278.1 GNAT family N-acetyltransferase [Spirochaetota bacterium]HPR46384.1 GNAT family N-acetyltransferase [Spirochaetota bacterium]
MIRQCGQFDFDSIYEVINDSALAYRGVIPEDRWHDPYMPEEELKKQIDEGVTFWCYEQKKRIIGVMGIQDRGDVTLIRHAYVRTESRSAGIGSALLKHLLALSSKPVLIGTWAAASWAVSFYRKHGFTMVSEAEKDFLLKKYWTIPERQVETSMVLADEHYCRTLP